MNAIEKSLLWQNWACYKKEGANTLEFLLYYRVEDVFYQIRLKMALSELPGPGGSIINCASSTLTELTAVTESEFLKNTSEPGMIDYTDSIDVATRILARDFRFFLESDIQQNPLINFIKMIEGTNPVKTTIKY